MPKIVSDIVDVYPFRRNRKVIQFLLLHRRDDVPLGNTWQAVHGRILPQERATEAALRELREQAGLIPARLYSADFINQFYDHLADAIILAPSFAALIEDTSTIQLAGDYNDYAWCDLEETVSRLPWSNQRWAVRHIYDVIALGGDEAEFYAIT